MEGYILQWMDGQTTVEGIDGGLHPAVDRRQWRALMEDYILQWTDDSEGHWWRATSCSGWTIVKDIDGGLHPALNGQSSVQTTMEDTGLTSCWGWRKPKRK